VTSPTHDDRACIRAKSRQPTKSFNSIIAGSELADETVCNDSSLICDGVGDTTTGEPERVLPFDTFVPDSTDFFVVAVTVGCFAFILFVFANLLVVTTFRSD
jgi:hypothetical protein